jgi:hypothetical protein
MRSFSDESERVLRNERSGLRLSFCQLASAAVGACSVDSRNVGTGDNPGLVLGTEEADGANCPPATSVVRRA